MSKIRFPEDMPKAPSVADADKMMLADASTNEAKHITFDQAKQYFTIEGQRIAPVAPGALPAGPTGQTRYMEVTTVGSWTYGGNTFTNADGYKTLLWWNGTTWSNAGSAKIKGDTGNNGKTIENYSDAIDYSSGSQVFFNGNEIYEALSATVAGESPTTTPAKWSKVFEGANVHKQEAAPNIYTTSDYTPATGGILNDKWINQTSGALTDLVGGKVYQHSVTAGDVISISSYVHPSSTVKLSVRFNNASGGIIGSVNVLPDNSTTLTAPSGSVSFYMSVYRSDFPKDYENIKIYVNQTSYVDKIDSTDLLASAIKGNAPIIEPQSGSNYVATQGQVNTITKPLSDFIGDLANESIIKTFDLINDGERGKALTNTNTVSNTGTTSHRLIFEYPMTGVEAIRYKIYKTGAGFSNIIGNKVGGGYTIILNGASSGRDYVTGTIDPLLYESVSFFWASDQNAEGYLEIDKVPSLEELLDEIGQGEANEEFVNHAPALVYAKQGERIDFNPNGIVGKLDIDKTWNIVRGNQKNLSITPTNTNDIEVEMRYRNYQDVFKSTGKMTVKVNPITAVNPSSMRYVLTMGDSTCWGSPNAIQAAWANEASRRLNGVGTALLSGAESPASLSLSNISFIGTLGNQPIKCEGRGGWGWNTYATQSANNLFWNPTTSKFDLNYYLTQQGFTGVSANGDNLTIAVNLGWNHYSHNDDFVKTYMYEILDIIKAQKPNAKVVLMGIFPPPYLTKREQEGDRNVSFESVMQDVIVRFAKLYDETSKLPQYAGFVEYLHIAHVCFPEKSYPIENDYLSRRNQDTYEVATDYVHPNNRGYAQMADVFVNWCLYTYCR